MSNEPKRPTPLRARGGLVIAEEVETSGLMQEANRQFFHPLGLTLNRIAVDRDAPGECVLVLEDHSLEPDGVAFHDDGFRQRAVEVLRRAKRVELMLYERAFDRIRELGGVIQRLPFPEDGAPAIGEALRPYMKAAIARAVGRLVLGISSRILQPGVLGIAGRRVREDLEWVAEFVREGDPEIAVEGLHERFPS